ncbi:MAG: glycosyltransferase family 2 protein [Planctomycetaceae bacterium]|nr:glycosyltransferase family 2 protein [Planctomycetaceae bacterium]
MIASLLAWLILVLATALVAVAASICAYHAALMLVSLGVPAREVPNAAAPMHSFAIVVPAHDEEATIGKVLDSCEALDYPADRRAVYVVADNCSDRTAELASGRGATCLIREDKERRGKGFALAWALPQVLAAGYDALLILDADCRIEPHALQVCDARLRQGQRVLQANDGVANPDGSATSYLLAVANLLENDCFYAPKSALGLAVFLRGTGMLFHRDVLLQFPWRAESVVEDAEYTCQLLAAGVRIRFVPEVRVTSDFPARGDQLAVQRERWVGGGLRMALTRAPRLLYGSLKTGRLVLCDAGVTMLVASRPLVIGQFLLAAAATLLAAWISPGSWTAFLMATMGSLAAVYAAYVGVGVARLGITRRRMLLLGRLPFCVASYLVMAMKGMSRGGAGDWKRTPRVVERDGGQEGPHLDACRSQRRDESQFRASAIQE